MHTYCVYRTHNSSCKLKKKNTFKKRNGLFLPSFKALFSDSDLSVASAIPASVSTDILLIVNIHINTVAQSGLACAWLLSLDECLRVF